VGWNSSLSAGATVFAEVVVAARAAVAETSNAAPAADPGPADSNSKFGTSGAVIVAGTAGASPSAESCKVALVEETPAARSADSKNGAGTAGAGVIAGWTSDANAIADAAGTPPSADTAAINAADSVEAIAAAGLAGSNRAGIMIAGAAIVAG